MTRWAALLLVALLPTAAAQVPDAGETVERACGIVDGAAPGVDLPVCPRDEPAAPAAQQAAAAPRPPAAPVERAGSVVGDAKQAADDVADDPTDAPDVLAGYAASLVAFVKGLLGVPMALVDAVDAAVASVHDAGIRLRDAIGAVGSAATDAWTAAGEGLAGLWDRLQPAGSAVPRHVPSPQPKSLLGEKGELVDGALDRLAL